MTAAQVVAEAWSSGLRPEPDIRVSDWSDRHRRLSTRGSAEPGPYRTSRTPYLREIMDCLSTSSPIRKVVFMKAAQVGASEAGNNWLGYIMHHAPGPTLAIQPTVELAERFSRQRVDVLIEETPALRSKVGAAKSRDGANTLRQKEFPGGLLVLGGANSAATLRGMTARNIFADELDAYPHNVDDEGDPVALARKRQITYGHKRKTFLPSTPTVAGSSRIEAEFEASDQRRYFAPCPHCGAYQILIFERLRWDKGKPETAHYDCEHCDGRIDEHHKTAMLAAGEWRATAEGSDPFTRGYHISGLYSPVGWLGWADIAREWLEAQGNDQLLQVFRNTVLGETWIQKGDAPEWQRLYDRREDWPTDILPQGVAFITAGADVQRQPARLEVDFWAWGPGLESWLIDHVTVEGEAADKRTWVKMDALLARSWRREDGAVVPVARMAIDTGFETNSVYAWARRHGFGRVIAVKGAQQFDRSTPVSGPSYVDINWQGKKIHAGVQLWTAAVSSLKAELYGQLRIDRPTDEQLQADPAYPAGYVHIPKWADTEWCKQLVAEQLVTAKLKNGRRPKGAARMSWERTRDRNEALDCRIYARAAAWILGADRWSLDDWRVTATYSVHKPAAKPAAPAINPVTGRPVGEWLRR